ncbi:MAG TPA: hypothetical protein VFY39_02315 [Gammaproteobacteria bacterium]|nr:hypothetical protein [Gammaproteobacteria bacterium]
MTPNDRDDPLRAALDALPSEIEPPRDLWPGIAARIAPPKRGSAYRRWSIAAAMLIALAAAIGTALRGSAPTMLRGRAPAEPFAASGPLTQTGAASPYFAARARFAEAAVRDSTGLTPETRTVLLQNLRIIETAMSNIQQALEKEPGNLQLRRLLFQLYQDEAAVLNAAQRVQLQTSTRTEL